MYSKRRLSFLFVFVVSIGGIAQSKKEQIEIMNQKIDSLNQVVGEQKIEISNCKQQIDQLEKRNFQLTSEISKLNERLKSINDKDAINQRDIENLTNALKIKTDSLSIVCLELAQLKPISKTTLSTNTVSSINSVKIGNQVWMARNLDVTNFKNGDPIPEVKTEEEWDRAIEEQKPAWCYYDNDVNNGTLYGKMYNWFAVNDSRGLAPEGWHIPTNNEWEILIKSVGQSSGKKLKSKSGWSENGNGTNTSGFNGLSGGERKANGDCAFMGYSGLWWSKTELDIENAWIYYLGYDEDQMIKIDFYKGQGVSVRCLMD